MDSARRLLEATITRYLSSGDFNSLFIHSPHGEDGTAGAELVEEGLLQVVSERDYPNPHIRPWPSRFGMEAQLADLRAALAGETYGVCLYPTPKAMDGRTELEEWSHQPYRRALAKGRGHLELAFFTLDVIEPYRNDPRYHFSLRDFEVDFGVGDAAYLDETEPNKDKINSIRLGFAYDGQTLSSERVERYLCAFLTDLADLTPEHQRRWQSYEVSVGEAVVAHPIWWAMMMGNWPDGIGPFDKILGEMQAINELWTLIWGERLFATTDRPREWGWVLRASTGAWHEFVQTTDKLLSDNIRHAALDRAGAPAVGVSGARFGTLARLRELLIEAAKVRPTNADNALRPLRRVRTERQKPAHQLVIPTTDAQVAARQRDLLSELGRSLEGLRELLARHPSAGGWQPPASLTMQVYRL